jgi:hypothetical protein
MSTYHHHHLGKPKRERGQTANEELMHPLRKRTFTIWEGIKKRPEPARTLTFRVLVRMGVRTT